MYSQEYKSKSGRKLYKPVFEDGETPFDMPAEGFCLGCGTEVFGVEPDARRYECECCGEKLVFGLEELCLMGLAVSGLTD